ncbi:AAA family ATPase [Sorangium sp. So ce513]|uniref:AAA family ATPase n=1 Tax=Sorangium sp. So ce513 TaxID=3133315 RepID=UPI003F6167C5
MSAPDTSDHVSSSNDRLLSVRMDAWPALGGPAQIDFGTRRTVLVGKNGAGKSMVMEGIEHAGMSAVYSAKISPLGPGTIRFDSLVCGRPVSYSYSWHIAEDDSSPLADRAIQWQERCWYTDSGTEIWSVAEGMATFALINTTMPLPLETGMLSLKDNPRIQLPDELPRLRRLFRGIRAVKAGVPRSERVRLEIQLTRNRPLKAGGSARRLNDRLAQIAGVLVHWFEESRDLYDAFVEVGRRIGVFSVVSIDIRKDTRASDNEQAQGEIARVAFDKIDFGYLSDGTLRVVEILVNLIDSSEVVLLIEEPETAIHPGLLRKLLAELDAYSSNRQIVISTHSPFVVDWALPSEIRLVERVACRTNVRALSESEAARVAAYLEDDGTLGEYIYGRDSDA